MQNLVLLLTPALLFPWLCMGEGRLAPAWQDPGSWPWQIAVMAVFGSLATAAGSWDWTYHRLGYRRIPKQESRLETVALCVGVAIFALMALGSRGDQGAISAATGIPADLWKWILLPVILGLLVVVIRGILADERRFHRKVSRLENGLHRTLVLGHAIVLLAWSHLLYLA